MVGEHVLLGFFWVLYGVIHSVLASQAVKATVRARSGAAFRYYRLFYTVLAALLLFAVLWFQLHLSSPLLLPAHPLLAAAGWMLSTAGLVLMLICIRKYFVGLSGLRGLFEERSTDELHISGVHRFVRHPLYLGTFAFIWGLFLLRPLASLAVMDAVITLYTLVGIRLEEQKLVLAFGEQYLDYRRRVPRLLPFMRPRRADERA